MMSCVHQFQQSPSNVTGIPSVSTHMINQIKRLNTKISTCYNQFKSFI
uniref:Uncharacterized protein n=1 Tax=Rhizophora mucronata TaxID=61149 RepID=A0A2P2QZM6_RHIMU